MNNRFPLDAVALTESLVAIDSRNPTLVPDGPGEMACARFLADVLSGWGFAVSLDEVVPGRPNVVARIGPTGRTPLVLNGHLDVVGTQGMLHEPFVAQTRDGNLFARGSSDMKGGIAAMCVAAARAAAHGSLTSEIIIAAVCDEEFASIGTRALLDGGLRATGAVVTEPTRLEICPAHKGFAWIEIVVDGKAAHGSRYDIGVDAVRHAAALVAEFDAFDTMVLTARSHALVGRPSLHAPMIRGGAGWSTFADECIVRIERRTIPGETRESVMREVQECCSRVTAQRPSFAGRVELVCTQPPSDLPLDAPLTRAMVSAAQKHDLSGVVSGLACWTDAALFNQAGIPALCFGPGDIARAHSAEEWVEVEQIERAVTVLEQLCASWGR